MKIIKNEKLIERNGKIGQWVSLGALAVLGLGMYLILQTRPFCVLRTMLDPGLHHDADRHVYGQSLGTIPPTRRKV